MDLQKTIDELEKSAAKYMEAANSLRVLLDTEVPNADATLPSSASTHETATQDNRVNVKSDGENGRKAKAAAQPKKRAPMSAEARARIGAATRARHEAKITAAADNA